MVSKKHQIFGGFQKGRHIDTVDVNARKIEGKTTCSQLGKKAHSPIPIPDYEQTISTYKQLPWISCKYTP